MSKAFSDFMDSWPTLKDSCGNALAKHHGTDSPASAGNNGVSVLPESEAPQQDNARGSASNSSLVLARTLNSTPANRTEERAKLFRETTRALLPEFSYLLKHEGGPNHIPHDCIENLRNLTCGICGARYERKDYAID